MRHVIVEHPVWTKDQREEAMRLVEFIERHEAARLLPDDLFDACVRLHGVLDRMVEHPKQHLERIGYATQSMVTRRWTFREGERRDDVPGPPPLPSFDVFVLRGAHPSDQGAKE